jgi:hypothetical protein
MNTTTKGEIAAEIKALENVELLIETNQGTYDAAEACRKVGCGDPQFADRKVYETVGGKRRETGPDESRSPGYMRRINADQMSSSRQRLAELRKQIRSAKG